MVRVLLARRARKRRREEEEEAEADGGAGAGELEGGMGESSARGEAQDIPFSQESCSQVRMCITASSISLIPRLFLL